MAAKIVKTIKKGALSIQIRKYADGRFGFDWKTPDTDRVKVRLNDVDDAEAKARAMLGAGSGGKLDLLSIDPDDFAAYLQWKATRRAVPTVGELIKSFLSSKEDKGLSYWHLRGLKGTLRRVGEAFGSTRLDALTRAGVEDWLNLQGVGHRRWNNLLEPIVSLIRFARRDGAISVELHPVEQIEKKRVRTTVDTYGPAEVEKILAAVSDAWRPVIALCAFCGLRPEEACSDPRTGKPSVTWENILWVESTVEVPAAVSKVGRRRFAPLTEAARAFLEPGREKTGRIGPEARISDHIKGWKRRAGVKWIKDGLRHSFASYRLAITRNEASLALEMGNSIAIIHANYLSLKHPSEAEKWFSLRPK